MVSRRTVLEVIGGGILLAGGVALGRGTKTTSIEPDTILDGSVQKASPADLEKIAREGVFDGGPPLRTTGQRVSVRYGYGSKKVIDSYWSLVDAIDDEFGKSLLKYMDKKNPPIIPSVTREEYLRLLDDSVRKALSKVQDAYRSDLPRKVGDAAKSNIARVLLDQTDVKKLRRVDGTFSPVNNLPTPAFYDAEMLIPTNEVVKIVKVSNTVVYPNNRGLDAVFVNHPGYSNGLWVPRPYLKQG